MNTYALKIFMFVNSYLYKILFKEVGGAISTVLFVGIGNCKNKRNKGGSKEVLTNKQSAIFTNVTTESHQRLLSLVGPALQKINPNGVVVGQCLASREPDSMHPSFQRYIVTTMQLLS